MPTKAGPGRKDEDVSSSELLGQFTVSQPCLQSAPTVALKQAQQIRGWVTAAADCEMYVVTTHGDHGID
jgi:hypothetical protein